MERNNKINIMAFILAGAILFGLSMPAAASYLPFNTSVNMNVGIGTSTPQGAFVVTNGNVGIGTWVPGSILSAVSSINGGGQFEISANDSAAWLLLRDKTGTTNALDIVRNFNANIGNYWTIGPEENVPLYFETNGTTKVTINANGSVGIGTTLSTNALDVSTTNGVSIGTAYAGYQTAPTNGLIVQGNVGIGSTAPGQALDVNGTARMGGFTLTGNGAANGNVLVGNSIGVGTWMPASTLGVSSGSGTNYWLNDTSGNVGISTTYAVGIGTAFVGGTGEAALSVMNGNVGIGTWLPNENLDVKGNIMAENGNVRSGGFGNFASADTIVFNDGSSGINMETNGLSRMYVTLAGNVGIGTTSPQGGLTVMNGNVGIGTWLPAYALDVENNSGIYAYTLNTGQINIDLNGGVGLVFGGSTNYEQIYGSNAVTPYSLYFGTGGSTQMTIMGSNVGIGSSAPGQILDVQGTVRMKGLTLTGNGAGNGNVLVSNGIGVGTWMPASTLATSAGSNYWLNDITGNVGISTTYAVGIGTTFVGGTGEAALSIMNGNVGIGTWVPNGSLVVMGGNVGIGTLAPSAKLSVVDSFTGTAKTVFVIGSTGGATGTDIGMQFQEAGFPSQDGAGIRAVDDGGSNMSLRFDTDLANTLVPNQMVISGSGNVGIGTVNPFGGKLIVPSGNVGIGTLVPGQLLDVQGTVRDIGELVNGNVGIGTSFINGAGEAALSIMNGSVGIGTWLPGTVSPVSLGPSPGVSLDVESANSTSLFAVLVNNSAGDAIAAFDSVGDGAALANGNGFGYAVTGLDIAGDVGGIATSESGIDAGLFADGITYGIYAQGPSDYFSGNVGIGSTAPGQALDVQGTARMTGFTLSGNGAANGDILVGNSVGVGTWMSTSTLTAGLLNTGTINQVAYYSGTTALSGNSKMVFVPASGNVGLGTVTPLATLQIIGNVGIGTVKNGDAFITTSPPSGGMIVEGNVGIGTPTTASLLQLGPGTSSKPPITLATGSIGASGTGTAGAIEFDGTAFYDTAAPSSRQVIDSEQFVALTNNFTLVNGSSAQPAFGGTGAPANGTLTVVPHTTYLFEALYLISNGTTTHETAVGFGGTATISAVDYSSYIWSVAANTPTTTQTFEWIQSAAMTNCNSTQSASNSTTIVLKGIIRIGASSGTNTIIPEIAFGHVPGGTNTMNNDSYFRIYPLGSDTTVYQGDWS